MSAAHVLQTTWAALLAVSVAGHFADEDDRREMADLAESIGNIGELVEVELDAHDLRLGMEALLVAFRAQRDHPLEPRAARPLEDSLAEMLTPERLGLAYLTLADLADQQASVQFDLTEASLASVSLSLCRLKGAPVMTDDLHAQITELTVLQGGLEDLLNTASPLELPEAETFILRQSVIASLGLLGSQPDALDALDVMPDLLAALTAERLNLTLEYLSARRRHAVGQA